MKIVSLFIVLLTLYSCSNFSTKKTVNHQNDSIKQQSIEVGDQDIDLEEVSNRIEELASSAKKSGPKAITYLAQDLFLKAAAATVHGNFTVAILLYRHLVAIVPDDHFIQKKYAMVLIRANELEKARDILLSTFKNGSDAEKIGLILGAVHTALAEDGQAQLIYQKILSENPADTDACVFLARSYYSDSADDAEMDKNFKRSIKQLKKCERKNPDNGVFAFYMGKFYLNKNEKTKAKQHFKRTLKIDKQYYQAAVGLGLLAEEKEDFSKALTIYKDYLKNDPENKIILSRVVQIMFSLSKFSEIIPYAETLANIDPSDLNLKVRLGILYSDSARYEEAIVLFKELLYSAPDSDKILYYLGAIYQETKKFEKAINYYSRVKESSGLYIDSSLQIAHLLQALSLRQQSPPAPDGEKMEQRFLSFISERSSKSKKMEIELLYVQANWYDMKGDLTQAVETLKPIADKTDFEENYQYYYASLLERNNQHQLAHKVVRKILEKNSENAHALNFLGYSVLEKGEQMDEAYKLIKKAVDLKPDDGYIRDSLGWYYYKMGKLDQALKHLLLAWKSVKSDVVIAKHIAMVYQALKRYENAKKYYLFALKNSKQESDRNSVLESLKSLENIRSPASSASKK